MLKKEMDDRSGELLYILADGLNGAQLLGNAM